MEIVLQLAARPGVRRPDGAELPLAARDAAILAWLAIEGPTPRQRLARLLWPERDADAARNSLRQRLFQLKRQLGAELVEGQHTLALAPGVGHDLHEADGVLADVELDVAGEFADWLAHQRARRRARLRDALVELATMAETAHDWPDALTHAHELLALEPLSEDAHRRVIRLHYLAGDRAAALLAFDACERVLKDEVGTPPSPETLALLRTIEAAEEPPAAGTPGAALPAAVVRPPRRVGREAEWQALQRHWAAGLPVWLDGEGGLGKSRLLADAVAGWRAGGAQLVAVGARPGDAELPYALLARVLRALAAAQPAAAVHALPEGVRAELARLLPEGGEPAPGAGSPARFAQAIETVFERAAAGGLLGCVVDDLHLADPASAEWLLRGAAAAGWRWVFAGRGAELPPATAERLDALAAEHRLAVLRLQPLDVDATAALLDSLALAGIGGAAQALQLHRHTGGNPMFLLEAVRALCSGAAPSGLPALPVASQVILRRIGRLSADAVRLARCAAIAGPDFSAALASRVLQVPPLDLADAWSELEAAQVLRDGAFTHDLIHEAARASVPAPIARELHRLIAQDLQSAEGEAMRIATHWLAAGDAAAAAPLLQRAGHQALARFRYAEAAQRLAQAGTIRAEAGAPAEAFDLFFEAADAAATLGDPAALEPLVERLGRLAEQAGDDGRRARAALVRALHAFGQRRLDEAFALARDALPQALRAGLPDVESELRYLIGVIHWDRREVAAAIAHVGPALAQRRALPAALQGAEHEATLIVMTQALGAMQGAAGRFGEAAALAREAFRLAERRGHPQELVGVAAELSVRESEDGRIVEALAWADRGWAAVAGLEFTPDQVRLATAHVQALWLGGRWGEVLQQLDRLAERMDCASHRYGPDVLQRRALLEWLAGRRDRALKTLQAVLARPTLTPPQRLAAEVLRAAVSAGAGEALPEGAGLLERVVAGDDVGLRSRLLLRLAPVLEPTAALPVLGLAAAPLREGARGLWLALQGRIACRLARAGRAAEAHASAQAAWQLHAGGVEPALAFAEFAADLAEGFAAVDPRFAAELAARGRAWMDRAIDTLPEAWRDNARLRHPLAAALSRATAPGLRG